MKVLINLSLFIIGVGLIACEKEETIVEKETETQPVNIIQTLSHEHEEVILSFEFPDEILVAQIMDFQDEHLIGTEGELQVEIVPNLEAGIAVMSLQTTLDSEPEPEPEPEPELRWTCHSQLTGPGRDACIKEALERIRSGCNYLGSGIDADCPGHYYVTLDCP